MKTPLGAAPIGPQVVGPRLAGAAAASQRPVVARTDRPLHLVAAWWLRRVTHATIALAVPATTAVAAAVPSEPEPPTRIIGRSGISRSSRLRSQSRAAARAALRVSRRSWARGRPPARATREARLVGSPFPHGPQRRPSGKKIGNGSGGSSGEVDVVGDPRSCCRIVSNIVSDASCHQMAVTAIVISVCHRT